MKKLALVYNPASGRADFPKKIDRVIEICQDNGVILTPYRTRPENPNLPTFLRETDAAGILIAGGDGTLHQVVDLLLKNKLDLPLGLIGGGTSNDFVAFLKTGILEHFITRVASDNPPLRYIDAGCANGEYFINVASAGMFTGVPHKIPRKWKNALGKLAYYGLGAAEAAKPAPLPLKIIADGYEYYETALFFVIINSPDVASFHNVAPSVAVDDGKLDLIVVRYGDWPLALKLTANLAKGKGISDFPNVLHIESTEFFIAIDGELKISKNNITATVESDLDGEKGPVLPLKITTIPKAVRFFV